MLGNESDNIPRFLSRSEEIAVMILRVKPIKRKERLFLIGYSLYLFYQIVSYSFYSLYIEGLISRLILVSCFAIFGASELIYERSKKINVITLLTITILAAISGYLGFGNIAYMVIIIFFARNVDFKHICKVTVWITIFGVVFVVISSKLGIIKDYIGYRGDGTGRAYLGFRYVLFAPGFLLNAMSAYIYIKDNKIKRRTCFFLIAISYLIYQITDARLSYYLSLFLIAFAFLNRRKRKIGRERRAQRFSKLIIPIYPVFLICSIGCAIFYRQGNAVWNMLDNLLTRRLYYGQKSLYLYGISLFGNRNIDWKGFSFGTDGTMPIYSSNMIYVDNVYLHILQRYGIVFTLIVMLVFTYTMYILYIRKDYTLQFMFFAIAIHGLIDNQILYLCFNVFLCGMYTKIANYVGPMKTHAKLPGYISYRNSC